MVSRQKWTEAENLQLEEEKEHPMEVRCPKSGERKEVHDDDDSHDGTVDEMGSERENTCIETTDERREPQEEESRTNENGFCSVPSVGSRTREQKGLRLTGEEEKDEGDGDEDRRDHLAEENENPMRKHPETETEPKDPAISVLGERRGKPEKEVATLGRADLQFKQTSKFIQEAGIASVSKCIILEPIDRGRAQVEKTRTIIHPLLRLRRDARIAGILVSSSSRIAPARRGHSDRFPECNVGTRSRRHLHIVFRRRRPREPRPGPVDDLRDCVFRERGRRDRPIFENRIE
ncbi:unnamed protein product [Darwinula stevensoni]|uniref:Uncharacterized protein n=1 Tax=Darwinula stevensoni TaxID=69355 RepID=A0A7R9AHZ3_9CRUS|nr:unnamed protein product [Darwinula stevensoni]CAG0905866.1 unnamed protein product [Darwinula stevensoni]